MKLTFRYLLIRRISPVLECGSRSQFLTQSRAEFVAYDPEQMPAHHHLGSIAQQVVCGGLQANIPERCERIIIEFNSSVNLFCAF